MMGEPNFQSFLGAYPPVPGETRSIDGVSLAEVVRDRFGIPVPAALQLFWLRVGAGTFGHGEGELYVFGDEASGLPAPEIVEWNAAPWWRSIYPEPRDGGPFFYAQTPFGDQLGFRWERGVALPELFSPDTMEVFLLGKDLEELLTELLVAPGALCDSERLYRARQQCPFVPQGNHLVPDESPLLGGKDDSFHVESPEGHLESALAAWRKAQKRAQLEAERRDAESDLDSQGSES
jgi:hypothetical protein